MAISNIKGMRYLGITTLRKSAPKAETQEQDYTRIKRTFMLMHTRWLTGMVKAE